MSVLDSYQVLGHVSTVTAPTTEPVYLATAKAHLRVDLTTEDSLILSLISAARQHVEQLTGLALITQTLDWTIEDFPVNGAPLMLPRAPVASVTSITSYNASHVAAVLSTSAYTLLTNSVPPRVVLNDGYGWPTDLRDEAAGVVRAVYGYGTTENDVPEPIRQAILLLIGHWFLQREPTSPGVLSPIPLGINALLAPYIVRHGVAV